MTPLHLLWYDKHQTSPNACRSGSIYDGCIGKGSKCKPEPANCKLTWQFENKLSFRCGGDKSYPTEQQPPHNPAALQKLTPDLTWAVEGSATWWMGKGSDGIAAGRPPPALPASSRRLDRLKLLNRELLILVESAGHLPGIEDGLQARRDWQFLVPDLGSVTEAVLSLNISHCNRLWSSCSCQASQALPRHLLWAQVLAQDMHKQLTAPGAASKAGLACRQLSTAGRGPRYSAWGDSRPAAEGTSWQSSPAPGELQAAVPLPAMPAVFASDSKAAHRAWDRSSCLSWSSSWQSRAGCWQTSATFQVCFNRVHVFIPTCCHQNMPSYCA